MKNDLAHYIGSKMKSFRTEKKMTQTDLGNVAEISKQAISNYERGYRSPQQNELFAISKALEVSIDELFPPREGTITGIYSQLQPERKESVYTYATDQLKEQQAEDNITHADFGRVDEELGVYLQGQVAAGPGVTYGDKMYDKVNTHVPKGADFALTVSGQSMEPLLRDGEIVFYQEQPTVENGEVAIVEIDKSEVTCKKVYHEGDKVILKSINKDFDDMIFDEKHEIRIIGKVIIE